MKKIKLEHITKVYEDNNNQCIALDNVSLTINKGDFIAICGKSGSGKTTLFRIISGIEKNYNGNCFIDDVNIRSLSPNEIDTKRRKDIGMIFQFFNLIPFLTVSENITICAELDGKAPSNSKIEKILKTLDLQTKKDAFIHELSGGQQQRVAIARAMYTDFDTILADEPTGNLDSANTKNIMQILLDMKKQNKTIVLITHDNDLAKMADRILILEDGKLQ